MAQPGQFPTQEPFFSIIVCVYDDWSLANGCLQSLDQQKTEFSFEVIIVDDGSTETAPEFIRSANRAYPFMIVHQSHAGIPTARNRGTAASKGTVLLFVDADSRLQANCLAALGATIINSPQHDYFQLRLIGNCFSLVGRAEELRLLSFQKHTLQPDGRIRYLNTAGFALRRAKANPSTGVFDPLALRGEDTLLLAKLMQMSKLPIFVADSVVEHYIPLSLIGCLRKDVRSAYLEARTYDTIASAGVGIRVTFRERLKLLSSTWTIAGKHSLGRSAWLVLVVRQALKRMLSFGFRCLRAHSKSS